ncbi:DMT family transporter [Primorskyibacter sp. S187A]|uniref:DMT family transporter n=1 Tax=Primorskyibacter sp. S187A TaxID=3415130 RepID=UPI003C7D6C02
MWKPVLMMFVAMSLIPAGDTAGKLLITTQGTSPLFVAWTRFWIGALLVLPFVPRGGFAILTDWRVILRALMLTGGICSILTALQTAPLADVFAAFFIGPSVSYLLAVVFLREPFSLVRAGLVGLGFCGMLIVVQPGGAGASEGLGWAVLAGCFYGAFLTASRWLSSQARPRALLFSQLFISAIVTTPAALFFLPAFSWPVAGLASLSAIFSMLGNFILLFAYRMAPATSLAPLIYFQLIAATGLGWFVFGTLPDQWTWIGLALILLSGVASALLAPPPGGAQRR